MEVGDKIVCINIDGLTITSQPLRYLTLNKVYTVVGVFDDRPGIINDNNVTAHYNKERITVRDRRDLVLNQLGI